ncbi:sperm flagellar protein 1 isoform X4 [Phasianus colchicus]|uniref:sperm flagellar protein 1 isoform X4 n=1 Tax=Phasianus colchicus TaxID=9054 RepID=UPI00129DC492|nr:sperm flagellar protein 1 isoform X4 [Phasianus colchicus]
MAEGWAPWPLLQAVGSLRPGRAACGRCTAGWTLCRCPGRAGTSPGTSAMGLHSFVPASSTPQKLANWGHLNRKVLSKLNFSVPNEVIRQIVQCRPGVVEQVLLLLRQKIEEKQKQVKAVPGPGQELGLQAAQEISYLETGKAGCSKARSTGGGCAQETPTAVGGNESHQCCAPAAGGDAAALRLQLAEREQALLLAQETIQILQMKVRRLEQLLRLKDMRIDDLSRCLQQARPQQQ